MTHQERRSRRGFLPRSGRNGRRPRSLAASAVTALTLMLFAGLHSWRPGQRVAQAPSLGLERAIPPSAAGQERRRHARPRPIGLCTRGRTMRLLLCADAG